jgi:hypothetical protein
MIGTSSVRVLCFRYMRLFFTMRFVRDLRSCVEDVTLAPMLPWKKGACQQGTLGSQTLASESMMIRFFESCS